MKIDEKFINAVSDRLISLMEKISELPERKQLWATKIQPQNTEGRVYTGANSLILSLDTEIKGYEYPAYITFANAKKNNISILKGSQSTPIISVNPYYQHIQDKSKITEEEYKKLDEKEKEKYESKAYVSYWNVFNIDQTNIREANPKLFETIKNSFDKQRESIKKIDSNYLNTDLENIITNNKWICDIQHKIGGQAFFSPSRNYIQLPQKEDFISPEAYYGTALHEMAHSTALPLERRIPFGKLDKESYAKEELVAELSSAVVASNLGFGKELYADNAHYLSSWLNSLKQEPEYIKEVLPQVMLATNYIQSHINKINLEQKIDNIQEEEKQEGKELTSTEEIKKESAIASMLAIPELRTKEYLEENNITDKDLDKDIIKAIETRGKIINEITLNTDPAQEDKLFSRLASIDSSITANIPKPTPNYFSVIDEAKRKDLLNEMLKSINFPELSDKQIYDTRKNNGILVQLSKENTIDNRTLYDALDVDYIEIPTTEEEKAIIKTDKKLVTKAQLGIKEEYEIEDTPITRDFLGKNKIWFSEENNKLRIPAKEKKIGLLLASAIIINPVLAPFIVMALKRDRLLGEWINKEHFSSKEIDKLKNGETLYKEHKGQERLYYMDKLNHISYIQSSSIHIPNKLNGIQLTPIEINNIKQGKEIITRDQKNNIVALSFNPNNVNSIDIKIKQFAEDKFIKQPTVNSPDSEKIDYIQRRGTEGINDIYGRGGVNLERDEFLTKYNIKELYKESLSSEKSVDVNFQLNKGNGISR